VVSPMGASPARGKGAGEEGGLCALLCGDNCLTSRLEERVLAVPRRRQTLDAAASDQDSDACLIVDETLGFDHSSPSGITLGPLALRLGERTIPRDHFLNGLVGVVLVGGGAYFICTPSPNCFSRSPSRHPTTHLLDECVGCFRMGGERERHNFVSFGPPRRPPLLGGV
jgi:hypothetical protein